MPDANGKFKGISVPRLPWLVEAKRTNPDFQKRLQRIMDSERGVLDRLGGSDD